MKDLGGKFYLVQENVLPQVLRKTAEAKEMLKKGTAQTVNDAVQAVGISRGAFYKYRDYIFPFREASRGKILTVSLILEHTTGVLSDVLKIIAAAHGNVLTINQGIPLQGVANASISFETEELKENVDELLARLSAIDGVQKLELVGQS
ncbi:MAG: ACT domain-containing protein [Bacillota bacterium]|nr:ACT domain-containing protein [Bacillota bacterium]MDW7683666.1 ACT domain-containing protein [Bacillota bacterium]